MTQDARRSAVMRVAAAAAVCAMVVTGAGVAAAASGGTWGTAREVPGTAALDQGGPAEALSVSCASAGNCSAGGSYADGPDVTQAFVTGEVNGTWHAAIEVPGLGSLNEGGAAQVSSVSCASAGNCAAGGFYSDGSISDSEQAFVASEVNGTWHAAIEVPGTAALNQAGHAGVNSVSCASAGNCAAAGFYAGSSGGQQAFVASEVNGTWHAAIEVPGTAALSQGAVVNSVSCASAGNCAAGGWYAGSSGDVQAFVAGEVNGTWHAAIEVPGTAALNQGSAAQVSSVSCASAGNCIGGGFYHYNRTAGAQEAFVASEVNGTWHAAIEVPGTAALNQGEAAVNSVSCASAGNCAAAGFYAGSSGQQAFVASEVNGTWHAAIEVPGTAALNQGEAAVNSVSCASAGNCAAAGFYAGSSGQQAFVASEVNGTWHAAIEVPGTAALNQGGLATALSVSCAIAGNCAAAGFYMPSSRHVQAFVVNQRPSH